ncbi:MAG: hypothetical protein Q7R79_01785 [bacterium]|nr:hypothetical protein [bacterium]
MPRRLLETGFFVLETNVYLEDDPYLSYAPPSESYGRSEKHGPFKTKEEALKFVDGPLKKKIKESGYQEAYKDEPVLQFKKGYVEERSD